VGGGETSGVWGLGAGVAGVGSTDGVSADIDLFSELET
jgi:hypothetical protein